MSLVSTNGTVLLIGASRGLGYAIGGSTSSGGPGGGDRSRPEAHRAARATGHRRDEHGHCVSSCRTGLQVGASTASVLRLKFVA